jgi:hypothetical protein
MTGLRNTAVNRHLGKMTSMTSRSFAAYFSKSSSFIISLSLIFRVKKKPFFGDFSAMRRPEGAIIGWDV